MTCSLKKLYKVLLEKIYCSYNDISITNFNSSFTVEDKKPLNDNLQQSFWKQSMTDALSIYISTPCLNVDVHMDFATSCAHGAKHCLIDIKTTLCVYWEEVYAKPCQTPRMEIFANIVNSFQSLTGFAKSSNLNVCYIFECTP